MPSYDLTGTVKTVMDEQTFDSGFTKREFVVTTQEDRFPQDIKFECVKDKTSLLEGVNAGQQVKVTFDLRGNEYKGRYYVNLTAWRLEPAENAAVPMGDAMPSADDEPPLDQLQAPPVDDDSAMPF